MLPQIKIVLVETTHPGNIGASARAMKSMGLKHLGLVNPAVFPHPEATRRAAGADDVLEGAQVCVRLDDVIADCALVVGCSARARSVEWPTVDPRGLAQRLQAESPNLRCAILFGRESRGLTNEEVDRCHLLIRIPTSPDFASLNVASAVQVIAYELLLADTDRSELPLGSSHDAADASAMAGFYDHLEQTLATLRFSKTHHSTLLMRKLKRLFNRARPDDEELNILRGVLTAAQDAARRPDGTTR